MNTPTANAMVVTITNKQIATPAEPSYALLTVINNKLDPSTVTMLSIVFSMLNGNRKNAESPATHTK